MILATAVAVLSAFAVGIVSAAAALRRGRRKVEARLRDVSWILRAVPPDPGEGLGAPPGASVEQSAAAIVERLAVESESVALLAAALDTVADAVLVLESDGSARIRNRAAVDLVEDMLSGALVAEAIDSALVETAEGEAVDRDLHFYGPPPRQLLLRARPLEAGDRDHQLSSAVIVIEDVSDARRVDSMRRDFVANVSHELRTPIGAITLLAETALASGDADVYKRLAERIVRESERLGRIVDDLLDLSVIEAEQVPFRVPVRIADVISEAADQVRAVAAAAKIPLGVGAVSVDLWVSGDRHQLVGVLVNLMDNAVKYSGPESPVDVDAFAQGGQVVIEVRDSGIGIPRRHVERIFERFYRVDRDRSRESGGTGLGLSIVRHVVRAHGGDVTVDSREGEGSTFRVALPAIPIPAADADIE